MRFHRSESPGSCICSLLGFISFCVSGTVCFAFDQQLLEIPLEAGEQRRDTRLHTQGGALGNHTCPFDAVLANDATVAVQPTRKLLSAPS